MRCLSGPSGQRVRLRGRDGLSPPSGSSTRPPSWESSGSIFVKGADDTPAIRRCRRSFRQAGAQLIRRRFTTTAELIAAVMPASSNTWSRRNCPHRPLRRSGLSGCHVAGSFRRKNPAFRGRPACPGFPARGRHRHRGGAGAPEPAPNGRPTHAAILLFGNAPQRFLISSEVKCAHFHGTEVRKPIPFYQVYKGTVFDLVDQAVDFVLSKINLAVGTRAHSTQAPVAYEMPPEVVREAIVNAVAHRDYTSNGSVQVMLFCRPAGGLEPRHAAAVARPWRNCASRTARCPATRSLAEPLYLTKYIERMGTGTGDMIERCRKAAASPSPSSP